MNDTATVTALPVAQAAPPAPVVFTERDAFELALRKAKVYASSTLVPSQYQESIPNCLIALNMARRIGADELQVMQNLYIVQGKPGWSGQFLIATFNQCGKFTALRFEWQGQAGGKDWACRAYATEKSTGDRIVGSWVTWKMVEAEGWSKKSGSKWLTMPEQMFMYRAAAFLVRTHAPEIAMGLQTVEELRDVIDVEVEPAQTKTDAVAAALRSKLGVGAPVPDVDPATGEITQPAAASNAEPKPEVAAPAANSAASPASGGPSYAEVRARLDRAKDGDALDDAVSLIASLPQHFHGELRELADKRRAALEG